MHQIASSLLFIGLSILTNTVSSQNIVTKEYDFPPGEAVILTNTLATPLSTQCEMHVTTNVSHSMAITVLKGSGVINGTSIKKGESMVLTVRQMQRIPVIAVKDAQAQFTNLGSYVVKASCG